MCGGGDVRFMGKNVVFVKVVFMSEVIREEVGTTSLPARLLTAMKPGCLSLERKSREQDYRPHDCPHCLLLPITNRLRLTRHDSFQTLKD